MILALRLNENNGYYVEYSFNNITEHDDVVEKIEGSTHWFVSL